jgi:hypothetical protein
MTRQVTDNLYIDLEYFTPEEYYTYEAEATASASASAELSVDIGVIKQGVSTQTSAFDLSATISHIEGVDIVLSNFASFTLTPSVTREVATSIDSAFTAVAVTVAGNVQNASASFVSEFTQTTDIDHLVGASSDQSSSAEFAVDAVANRSAAITLDTIGNLDAQAARFRDYSSDLASAFTITALSNSILEFDAFLEYEIPDLFVDAEKTLSGVSAQTSVFTQAALASKLVEAASTQTSAFAQTAAVSRTRPADSTIAVVASLTAQGSRVTRVVTSNTFIGDAYSELEITNEQAKFGGKSLKIPATTAVSVNGNRVFWTGSAFKIIQTGTTWTSTDGLTWTTASNNLTLTPSAFNLVFQNNQFLIKSGSTIAYANSTGTSFSTTTLASATGVGNYYVDRIDFFNGNYYVAYRELRSPSTIDQIGFSRTASLSSPSWSDLDLLGIDELLGGGVVVQTIANSGSTFAVQIKSNTNSINSIYRTTDGSSWNSAAAPTTDSAELTFANGQWVLWTSTAVWTSTNLTSWTSQTISVTGTIQAIYYLNNKWIVTTTYALYSGSAFNSLSATIVKAFNEVSEFFPAFGSSKYIVLSNDEVLYSTDAVSWSADTLEGVSGLAGYIEYTGSSDINAFNTIDFWVHNNNTISQSSNIFYRADGLSTFRIILSSNTLLVTVFDGTTSRSLSTGNILSNGWNHIRFVQDGANASLYSGGTRRATATNWLAFNTDTFYIGGREAAKTVYIDEFLISDSILTPTSTTSYTVPTVPWTNSSTVDALFHYDTNFDDDAATTDRLGSASIASTASVTVQASKTVKAASTQTSSASLTAQNTRTRDTSSNLAANGFVVTVAGYLLDDVADLTANTALTASVNYTVDAVSSQSAQFAQTAIIGYVKDSGANLSSDFQQSVDASVARGLVIDLNSEFAQSTVESRLRGVSASLVSEGFVLAIGGEQQNVQVNITATASLTAEFGVVKQGLTSLDAVATLTANVGPVRKASADLSSAFTQSASGDRLRLGLLSIDAAFTVTSTVNVVRDINSALFSASTLSVTASRTRDNPGALDTFTTMDVQGNYVAENASTQNAVASQTAQGNYTASAEILAESVGFVISVIAKTGEGIAELASEATQTTQAVKTVSATAALSSAFAQTVTATRIIQYERRTVTGAETQPNYWLQYADDGLEAVNFTTHSVISFWSRRTETLEETGVYLWNRQRTPGLPFPFGPGENYNQDEFKLSYDGTTFKFNGYQESGSAGNTRVNLSWANVVPTDTEWHHYLIHASSVSGAFPGNVTLRLWVDGDYKSLRTATGPATYGYFNQWWSPVDIGYGSRINIAQLWAGIYSFTNENIPTVFYNNGWVDIPEDGTVSGGTPYLFALLDNPFNEEIQGVYDPTRTNPNNEEIVTVDSKFIATYRVQGDSSQAQMTVLAQVVLVESAFLTAISSLTADLTGVQQGRADITSTANLSVNTRVTKPFAAALQSEFTVTASAGSTVEYDADFTATTTLTADVIVESGAFANLVADTALSANAGLLAEGTVTLESASTLSVNADRIKDVFMGVDSACAVQASAIKTASAEGTLANTATLSIIFDRIPAFRIDLSGEFAVVAQAVKTTNTGSTQTSAFTLTPTPNKIVGISANFTAFYSQLTVGRVISLDPFTTYVVPQETRAYKIHRETRLFTVESESRSYKIRKESRLYTIDSESRIYNIKG